MYSSLSEIDNTEKLIDNPFSDKHEFQILLIAKNEYLFPSLFKMESIIGKIIILPFHTKTKIKINFNDILTILSQDELQAEQTYITKLIRKRYNNDNIQKFFQNKIYAKIYYFNRIEYKECSLTNILLLKFKSIFQNKKTPIKQSIQFLISQRNFDKLKNIIFPISNVNLIEEDNLIYSLKPQRKMLIIINPQCGIKNGYNTYIKAKKIFDIARVQYDTIITKTKNDAYKIVSNLDINDYNGIVAISGDGTIHEIINAMLNRNDREKFISSVSLGVVPCGNSNALAKTIALESKEGFSVEECAFIIIKGLTRSIDIQEIEGLIENKKIYSFRDISSGISALVDLYNPLIFKSLVKNVYSIYKILCIDEYNGTLIYLPFLSNYNSNNFPSLESKIENNKMFAVIENNFPFFVSGNIPFCNRGVRTCSKAKMNDEYNDIVMMLGTQVSKKDLLIQMLYRMYEGNYFDKNGQVSNEMKVNYVKTQFWRFIPMNGNNNRFYSVDGEKYQLNPIQVRTLHNAIRVFCKKDFNYNI